MKKKRSKLNAKSKRNIIKFLKIFAISFCVIVSVCILLLIAAITGIIDTTANLDLESYELNLTSQIYYIDPETGDAIEYVDLFAEENRRWADLDDIPQIMQDAIVSIEDERFYDHNGVDFLSTGKATILHIFGAETRGGSTITQQLVKNLTKENEVTISRKATEILRAMNVERKWTKKQILEMYLNTIYLSNGCNGVAAASDYYFGKDIADVTIAEAALLAGITQYPSLYDPVHNFKSSKEKQELVLGKMLELKKITQEEYDAAKKEKLTIYAGDAPTTATSDYSYFADMIIEDVIGDLVETKGYSEAAATALIFNGGLKIYATVDPDVQESLETYFEDLSNFPLTNQEVYPQSAMIIVEPGTGKIKGVVGGIGKKTEKRTLNRATQTLRQPGSTMKPIGVYAPAIEKGIITPDTQIVDKPININGWTPKNYGSSYHGNVSIRHAVAQSLNSVAVQILQQVGIDYSYKFLTEKLGVTSLVSSRDTSGGEVSDKNLSSLALGGLTDGVSLLEMAGAYSAFANNGVYIRPYSYTKVISNDGETLLEHKDNGQKAMSENTAYSMVSLLKGTVTGGTGTAANFRGDIDICGKTGTTDKDNDRWFVGFTPYYVAASWYGYDIPKSIYGVSGNPAIPAWKTVMAEIHKDLPGKQFKIPSGYQYSTIELEYYCTESNCIANQGCHAAGTAEIGEAENDGVCSHHSEITVDVKTGMLATENCPVEETAIIGYSADNVSGNSITTDDGVYEMRYCTTHTGNGIDATPPSGRSPGNSAVSDAPVILY